MEESHHRASPLALLAGILYPPAYLPCQSFFKLYFAANKLGIAVNFPDRALQEGTFGFSLPVRKARRFLLLKTDTLITG
jgi:hypothetical protein